MSGIQGVDEFEDFAESMSNIANSQSGIGKAKRNALRATLDDFVTALTQRIKAGGTAKGGTLDSRTSPYEPGGENESTGSNLHISDKKSWVTDTMGDDFGVVYPNPEIRRRAEWMNYGTADHGPTGDTPMYFKVGNIRIVVADKPERASPFYKSYTQAMAVGDNPQDAKFAFGEPTEVSGVEPQGFYEGAIKDIEGKYKENMGEEIDKLFEEEGLTLEGTW